MAEITIGGITIDMTGIQDDVKQLQEIQKGTGKKSHYKPKLNENVVRPYAFIYEGKTVLYAKIKRHPRLPKPLFPENCLGVGCPFCALPDTKQGKLVEDHLFLVLDRLDEDSGVHPWYPPNSIATVIMASFSDYPQILDFEKGNNFIFVRTGTSFEDTRYSGCRIDMKQTSAPKLDKLTDMSMFGKARSLTDASAICVGILSGNMTQAKRIQDASIGEKQNMLSGQTSPSMPIGTMDINNVPPEVLAILEKYQKGQ